MKTFETTKLFYNKYLYKVVLINKLAITFTKTWNRNNWSHVKKELERLDILYREKKPLYRTLFRHDDIISTDDYLVAKSLLYYIQDADMSSYTLRTENNTLSIVSNNKDWLSLIKSNHPVVEWWEPKAYFVEILQSDPKISLKNPNFAYNYKVYLKDRVDCNLAKWLHSYQNSCKVGPVALKNIEDSSFTHGNYFYVKDEKTLLLLKIPFINSIKRIEKLVSKDDVDKYNYGIEQ